MLIPELLFASARRHPAKDAVRFPSGGLSFQELDERSTQVARRLRARGIGPGDRVALISENDPAALIYFWGVLKSGAATVDLPPLAAASVIEGVLEEARPKAVAAQARQLEKLVKDGRPKSLPGLIFGTEEARAVAASLGAELVVLEEILASEARAWERPAVSEDDVAMIVYTSGTTGRPKGVMLSHRNMVSNITAANSLVGLSAEDSILMVVPFYFIHGRMQLLTHALTGGTVVVSAGFQFPTVVLDEIVQHKVRGFSGVPYHFITLLERTKLKSTPVPDLRYVLVTGGALSAAGLDELRQAMPAVDIHTAYGQTEASPRITYHAPADMFTRKGSAGKPLPGVVVEIVDDQGRPLPQGEIGEVVASGPNIMRGYVSGDHVSSGRIDAQGRLRTGDLGFFDAEGYLWLRGRSSEMIKTAGERVFPKEIEDAVVLHPAVAECAVIGVPDATLGERIVAFVVLKAGQALSYPELRNHCLKHMPFVRVPRELKVLDKLPKTASGKLSRGELPKLYTHE